MTPALRRHWPEYLIEAALLGTFMLSACSFGTLLEHPASPVRQAIGAPLPRRVFMGTAMALTALAMVYSPWGKRSGAHFNPAVTLTFWRLGKVAPVDAAFYALAQIGGGLLGVGIAWLLFGDRLGDAAVNYVATLPGPSGAGVAFLTEAAMTFVLMSVVLGATAVPRLARFTGVFVAILVASYISLLAPLSGMSMNPARTFASAVPAGRLDVLWIYFLAPPFGMLAAAEVHLRARRPVACAKLHHVNAQRCIHCAWQADRQSQRLAAETSAPRPASELMSTNHARLSN